MIKLLALAILATAFLSGCNANLSKREIVVQFAPTATPAQHVAARAACATAAPHSSPEPIVHTKYITTHINDIRFRVDKADDHDLNQLFNCLRLQPGVIGVSDPMDMTR